MSVFIEIEDPQVIEKLLEAAADVVEEFNAEAIKTPFSRFSQPLNASKLRDLAKQVKNASMGIK